MKLAFWPGLGGGALSLAEIGPVLAERGIDSVALDPRYGDRPSWELDTLAEELVGAAADVYAGHSWGAAVAAVAATKNAPLALILLDGGYVSPAEFARMGAKETADERLQEIRAVHEGYHWPSSEAYLDEMRSEAPRWNDTIEAMALEGMRHESGEVLPPFDSDELEEIIRGYEAYDAPATLAAIPRDVRVLLVAASPQPEHVATRDELLERFTDLVPNGEVRHVESPHDLIWGLGPALGTLVADWLEESS
jgi:pimeloyl-ACP methyl ester carboxylesterase